MRIATAFEKKGGMCWVTAMGGIVGGRLGSRKRRASTPPVDEPITIRRLSLGGAAAAGELRFPGVLGVLGVLGV
jgi:hypothetical protein